MLAVVGMNITASKANFWALWAFVNGMYFQLQSLRGICNKRQRPNHRSQQQCQIFPIWIEQLLLVVVVDDDDGGGSGGGDLAA